MLRDSAQGRIGFEMRLPWFRVSAAQLYLPSGATIQSEMQADVAQLVEQLIRNQQVVSSSLTVGSILSIIYRNSIEAIHIVSTILRGHSVTKALRPRLKSGFCAIIG